jgi:steroid delta-isomerase-like uncharacterized protein
MSRDAHRDQHLHIARRYFEDIWNRGDLAAVEALMAPDLAGHVNGRTFHGRETLKQRLSSLWSAFPEPRFAIDDALVDGDRALIRWTFRGTQTGPYLGHPATGRTVAVTGMNLFRLAGGRIAELWVNADDLGELEQLGLVTVPGASG